MASKEGVTDPERFPAVSTREQAILMSIQPVHAVSGRTLRHWTIDSQRFVGESQEAAPALPYSEERAGGQFQLLASKLARVKFDLVRPVAAA